MKRIDYKKIIPLEDPAELFDLSGRVGLITGGGGKLGRQFALVLGRAGASVVLADKDERICRKAAKDTSRRLGREIDACVCDVSDVESVKQLFAEIKKRFGRLDFFVSNVMAKPEGYYRPLETYSLDTWKEIHDINLAGAFLCCREAVELLAESRNGNIVLTSSIYGLVSPDFRVYENCSAIKNPYGGFEALTTPAAYSSSKGGLIALAKYLAVFLAPKKIRVNVLTPGGVFDDQEEGFHQEYIKRVPLGRMAVWSDYNGAILFLISDASRYMTGANLVVDGGWTVW